MAVEGTTLKAPDMMLGRLGHSIPAIGLGTWECPPGEVGAAVEAAIEAGYRHIDCAWIYRNEKEIGEALGRVLAAGKVKREDLFITSKCWNTHKTAEQVRAACEHSIRSLGVGYLDLYLVHWPVAWQPVDLDGPLWGGEPAPGGLPGTRFAQVPLSATWAAFEQLAEDGLVRHLGVSNFGVQLLADLLTYCRVRPVCNQVELHPYHAQQDLLMACGHWGISLVAYSPLGSSVAWQKGKPNVRDDPVIAAIAAERGQSPADVIIRWHLQRYTGLVPKSATPAHIRSNLAAAYSPLLSDAHMASISALDKKGAGRYIPGDQPWSSFA